jgi:nickel/cobalt transporter (NiCoT) family protein
MKIRDASRWSRFPFLRLTQAETALIGMFSAIGALHVVGWITLLAFVVPQHFSIGTKVFGIGIGITAYTLGMRHAFDADHIAAIDNTTRKLMQGGQKPLSVGFWFSLGHSSIVFVLTLLLAVGLRMLAKPLLDDHSALHDITGLTGTIVSGGFLYLIALVNLFVLIDIAKVLHAMRNGVYDAGALESQLEQRGIMSRILRPAIKLVEHPVQMYFVGLLFGLGFDTVTEIALLVLTGSGVASGLPWYAVLCLPILFAAGMSLMDTLDGSLMYLVYGWALSQPVRKIYYNLIITGLSIVVAFVIGTVEILSLLSDKLNFRGAFWTWISGLDLGNLGIVIVAIFIAAWALALAVWKYGRIESRWTPAPRKGSAEND